MSYAIVIATLGYYEEPGYHTINRADITTNRLAYNLEYLWAWNITGQFGFESDGPAVFISFDNYTEV